MVEIDTPNPADVLCGKDKTFGKHPGNLIYRNLIADRSADYASATSKRAKMDLSKLIISTMQHKHGSRFLRQVSATSKEEQQGGWVELSNQQARDKATHALRFWNDHKSTKDRSPNEDAVGEMKAVMSSQTSSQGVSSPLVARASTALPVADLDPEAPFAAYQQQQRTPLSNHYPSYSQVSGSQQPYADEEYQQHHQSTHPYYDMRDNPWMEYSAEAAYADSQTHRANNEEHSSGDASCAASSSLPETTFCATGFENDTTIATACSHERRQHFVHSSLRHDQHLYFQHGEMDAQRGQRHRPAEEDTLDLNITSNRCNESTHEEGNAPASVPFPYPPTPLPPAIDDPDRNSLMLLSTIRSLSLVDCMDDDILSAEMPGRHPPDQHLLNELIFHSDHPSDHQQALDGHNNDDDCFRRRVMTHTEETALQDLTDIQRLLNDSLGSDGSSGSMPDDG